MIPVNATIHLQVFQHRFIHQRNNTFNGNSITATSTKEAGLVRGMRIWSLGLLLDLFLWAGFKIDDEYNLVSNHDIERGIHPQLAITGTVYSHRLSPVPGRCGVG